MHTVITACDPIAGRSIVYRWSKKGSVDTNLGDSFFFDDFHSLIRTHCSFVYVIPATRNMSQDDEGVIARRCDVTDLLCDGSMHCAEL